MKTLQEYFSPAVVVAAGVAFTGVALLSVPNVHAEVLQRPDTPMAAIIEINHDYVRVQGLNVYTADLGSKTATDHLIDSMTGQDVVFFDTGNQSHLQQVADLAYFGCRLYNRESVFAGEFHGGDTHGPIFLFACAIP